MRNSLTLDEVNEKIKDNFIQRVEALEYKNRRSPLKVHCLECDYVWEMPATTALYKQNHSCPNCNEHKAVILKCSYCGKEMRRVPSSLTSKSGYYYCSIECGNRHKNLLRGQNGEWDNSLNYRLKAMNNLPHKCAVCGWDEDERILEVHHKDEDRTHNQLDNLCILCPTCHRKITLGYYVLTEEYTLKAI